MKTRETFEQIRNRKKERLTLRVKMIIMVQAELLLCAALAFLIDNIAHSLNPEWKVPLFWEMAIISLIVGAVATSFVSKIFFNPMKKLRKAIETVANGDFTVRLDPKESASGEVQELYAGFNLMTHEISATEVLQTDFVSNVSHEFKTPINAIEGYSTLLQGGDNLDEDQREYVDKILFNTKRLSTLVSNILLLSKIENQSIQTHQQWYGLDEQVRESILALEAAWAPKDIEFDVDLDDIEYYGNESMVHHVWDNLIGNAIKFSPQGGVIKIRLQKKTDRFIFIVEDEGPGLSEEAKKHVFDKFYQEDTSHKQEGNGLGLALVKRILSIEHGEIAVENLPEKGCRFTVTLKANK